MTGKSGPIIGRLFSLSLIIGFGLSCAGPKYPDGLYAELATSKGLIVLRLEFERTPLTVASFVGLAEGRVANDALPLGTPYFDGTVFHRVVPGHVIQAGIPKNGRAEGPGYEFPNEIDASLGHGRAGMAGMANSGPHTNGSQFYITLGDRSYLDGDYTVFGEVVEGLDVVQAVVQGDDVRTVRIVRVGRAARSFRPETTSFRKTLEEAWASTRRQEEEKKKLEASLIAGTWPQATVLANGVRVIILRAASGPGSRPGSILKAAYVGKTLAGIPFVSTADEGQPEFGERPEPFDFVVGSTRITPGLDEVLAGMRKGEKKLVIVPAALAYGSQGFYARQKSGQKRFHISPHTTLVYEVEILDILPSPAR
ncbi:MAG: peptidylprolyl isomerase [Candidatus Aminicenantes bacterium]|nr:peptidylprolyl isomerase [Candidatus Aminicenantes bacterium]